MHAFAPGLYRRLEEAIAVLNKSLMEHRTPDTLAALNKTEKVRRSPSPPPLLACMHGRRAGRRHAMDAM